MNSFKLLYDKRVKEAGDFNLHKKKIKNQLDHNYEFMALAGDMIELFVPRVFDYLKDSLEKDFDSPEEKKK